MLLKLPPGFLDGLAGIEDSGAVGGETEQGLIGHLRLSEERYEAIRLSLASLAVRANGTLVCLCQQAGVPAVGMGPWLLYSHGEGAGTGAVTRGSTGGSADGELPDAVSFLQLREETISRKEEEHEKDGTATAVSVSPAPSPTSSAWARHERGGGGLTAGS